MDLLRRYSATFRDALGPHWFRYVLVWGFISYTVATNVESFLRGRGVTFLPTLYSSVFVVGVGVVWFCVSMARYAARMHAAVEPKFAISFDRERLGGVPAVIRTTHLHPENPRRVLGVENHRATYLRIRVTATSRTAVKECRAFIVALDKRDSDKDSFLQVYLPERAPLREEPFIVMPDISELVDFMYASSKDNKFVRTGYWPFELENVFDDLTTYRFTFAVNGDGITAKPMCVEVDWHGQWDTISAREVPVPVNHGSIATSRHKSLFLRPRN